MLIALDYDKTYTLDPAFWDGVIRSAKERGHSVICCTMRRKATEGKEVLEALEGKADRIFFTEREAKLSYLARNGVPPDVWIDDSPHWIYQNG